MNFINIPFLQFFDFENRLIKKTEMRIQAGAWIQESQITNHKKQINHKNK